MSDNYDKEPGRDRGRHGKQEGDEAPKGPAAPQSGRLVWAWISLVLFTLVIASLWVNGSDKSVEIDYNPTFVDMVDRGLVKKVKIYHDPGLNYVKGETIAPEKLAEEQRAALKDVPPLWRVNVGDVTTVENLLEGKNVGVEHVRQSNHMALFLYNIFPTLLLIGVIYFIFVRQMRSASAAQ